MDTWLTVGRIGFVGRTNDRLREILNRAYGASWRKTHLLNGKPLSWREALEQYEFSYYLHFRANPRLAERVRSTASEIYDNEPSNVDSGLDYAVQETRASHYQDIAIRRALTKLELEKQGTAYDSAQLPRISIFHGDRLCQVRSSSSDFPELSPGEVPFHEPGQIMGPYRAGFWKPGTIEAFWQNNKVLQIKDLRHDDALVPPNGRYSIGRKELDVLTLHWCTFGSERPTIYGVGEIERSTSTDRFYVHSHSPYMEAEYISSTDYRDRISQDFTQTDFILRTAEQLPPRAVRTLARFTTSLEYVA
jgi:hypothetical protein